MYIKPTELLKKLIRFNTTNPTGNEAECIGYIRDLLTEAGLETKIISKDTSRPNLIARLRGAKTAPPLMCYGHADVVTTEDQSWIYPPFEGESVNGYIWGR